MQTVNPSGSYLLRLDHEQRGELDQMARAADMPIQHFIELRLFGRVKPRTMGRPRKNRDQPQLPIDEEERPLDKSA